MAPTRATIEGKDWVSETPRQLYYSDSASRRTAGPAWHYKQLVATGIVPWTSFDQDLSEIKARIPANRIDRPVFCECTGAGLDSVMCGTETSLQGRFIQNVTQPVVDVLAEYGVACQCSDFLIVKQKFRQGYGATGEASILVDDDGASDDETETEAPDNNDESHTETFDSTKSEVEIINANESEYGTEWLEDLSKQFEESLSILMSNSPPVIQRTNKRSQKKRAYGKLPDIIFCKEDGNQPFLVGELKVPWGHPMPKLSQLFTLPFTLETQVKAEHWLAQICAYMRDIGLKYGFLSTYDYTVFLSFQPAKSGYVLRCSPVVTWNGEIPASSNGVNGYSTFALREAIFLLSYHCHSSEDALDEGPKDYRILIDRPRKE